jgi:hypothetical protein
VRSWEGEKVGLGVGSRPRRRPIGRDYAAAKDEAFDKLRRGKIGKKERRKALGSRLRKMRTAEYSEIITLIYLINHSTSKLFNEIWNIIKTTKGEQLKRKCSPYLSFNYNR